VVIFSRGLYDEMEVFRGFLFFLWMMESEKWLYGHLLKFAYLLFHIQNNVKIYSEYVLVADASNCSLDFVYLFSISMTFCPIDT
jgi:hypothetical protein